MFDKQVVDSLVSDLIANEGDIYYKTEGFYISNNEGDICTKIYRVRKNVNDKFSLFFDYNVYSNVYISSKENIDDVLKKCHIPCEISINKGIFVHNSFIDTQFDDIFGDEYSSDDIEELGAYLVKEHNVICCDNLPSIPYFQKCKFAVDNLLKNNADLQDKKQDIIDFLIDHDKLQHTLDKDKKASLWLAVWQDKRIYINAKSSAGHKYNFKDNFMNI